MDADAFDAIVRANSGAVRSFIAGRGVPLHEVDDIAQEVFLAYYRAGGQCPPDVELLRWLKGIARNLCNVHFRRDEQRQRLMTAIAARLEQVHAAVEDADAAQRLDACLERLAPHHRLLIARYYAEEDGREAIASERRMSIANLRVTVMRLRERLRRCLAEPA